MKIAIVYTTKHGTTEEIANKMADLLPSESISLFNLRVNKSVDLTPFDTVVLGSPVYAGTIPHQMETFLTRNEDLLLTKRLGLFLCGMEPEGERRTVEVENAYPYSLKSHAKVYAFLGGAFHFNRMNPLERLVVRKIAHVDKDVSRIEEAEIPRFLDRLNCTV